MGGDLGSRDCFFLSYCNYIIIGIIFKKGNVGDALK